MNSDILKGKWKQMKGDLKAKWGALTDDEWTEIGGNKDTLIGKLQEKYGRAKDVVSREVDEFLAKHEQNEMTQPSRSPNATNTGQRESDGSQEADMKQGNRSRKVS